MATQDLIQISPGSTAALSATPSISLTRPSASHFEKLPPELRNIIYDICIVTRITSIRSPLKKMKRKDQPFSSFWSLLLVNKNIHKEASSWYYTFNTFVFGHSAWGSTAYPNLHAMKGFVKRVNDQKLALITKVHIQIQARPRIHPLRTADTRDYVLGDRDAIADLRTLSRTLTKYFTSLQSIDVLLKYRSPKLERHRDPFRLSEVETVEVLRNFLLELLKLKSISVLRVFHSPKIPMHKAAERILESKPEISKILQVQDEYPFARPHP